MTCGWCRAELPTTDPRVKFCGQRCRQAAWRAQRLASLEYSSDAPARFAYADPPYPGLARKYYGREATFGGEVDHRALVAQLEAGGYLGWALSTSEKALRHVLPLCPPHARVCPWVKPIGSRPKTRGIHGTWEPLIVVGGRLRRPGKRNWLSAQPARFGGDLPGRKPLAFCTWMFGLLGMAPGDELDDLFPGTGVVGRAWAAVSSGAPGDTSLTPADDTSEEYSGDASPGAALDEGRAA
jgi:hypothetical protein